MKSRKFIKFIHLQLTEMFRMLEILSPGSDTNYGY